MSNKTIMEQIQNLLKTPEGKALQAEIERREIDRVIMEGVDIGIINKEQAENLRAVRARSL